MRRAICLSILMFAKAGLANDHNNLEHGRPLSFDDAYSIAFGEREIQFGLSVIGGRGGMMSSFAYGLAKNQELSIALDAIRGASTGGEVSFFQNVSRELEHEPALGYRITASDLAGSKPTRQLRLIGTKAWHQYDKVHINIDLETRQNPGLIFGYSTPIGYPKKFDQSVVADLGLKHQERFVGIGLRRQVDPRSILDFGLEAGKSMRISAGFSIAF